MHYEKEFKEAVARNAEQQKQREARAKQLLKEKEREAEEARRREEEQERRRQKYEQDNPEYRCPDCKGTGKTSYESGNSIMESMCWTCRGAGKIREPKRKGWFR
jgi:DnaJ-class molecular chaperone